MRNALTLPIMRSKWKVILLTVVVLVLIGDIALLATGKAVLIHSQTRKVVIWEGDIVLYAELAPKTGNISKPKDAVYCTYWTGISTTQIGFPGRLGCPRLLR